MCSLPPCFMTTMMMTNYYLYRARPLCQAWGFVPICFIRPFSFHWRRTEAQRRKVAYLRSQSLYVAEPEFELRSIRLQSPHSFDFHIRLQRLLMKGKQAEALLQYRTNPPALRADSFPKSSRCPTRIVRLSWDGGGSLGEDKLP